MATPLVAPNKTKHGVKTPKFTAVGTSPRSWKTWISLSKVSYKSVMLNIKLINFIEIDEALTNYAAARADLRQKQARVDNLEQYKKKKCKGFSAGVYS